MVSWKVQAGYSKQTMRIPSNQPGTPEAGLAAASATVHNHVRQWLERAVLGLNLCPFARPVHENGLLPVRVVWVRDEISLLIILEQELRALNESEAEQVESSLLVHPVVLQSFSDYNSFLDRVDDTVNLLGLNGVIQVASFHPDYQFAGVAADDITNCTNRAPYPMLHLLRESSVGGAVDSLRDPASIPERNQKTLETLGRNGWDQLSSAWKPDRPTDRPTQTTLPPDS